MKSWKPALVAWTLVIVTNVAWGMLIVPPKV
jgi:hypothetical protein